MARRRGYKTVGLQYSKTVSPQDCPTMTVHHRRSGNHLSSRSLCFAAQLPSLPVDCIFRRGLLAFLGITGSLGALETTLGSLSAT